MSATTDCHKYMKGIVKPRPEETIEDLAQRMFDAYIECMSAHAGSDINVTWEALSDEIANEWRETAQLWKENEEPQ